MKIKERYRAESSPLFKRITNVALSIGSIGFSIVSGYEYLDSMENIHLPVFILHIGGYMTAIGFVGAAISKMEVKNDNNSRSNKKIRKTE